MHPKRGELFDQFFPTDMEADETNHAGPLWRTDDERMKDISQTLRGGGNAFVIGPPQLGQQSSSYGSMFAGKNRSNSSPRFGCIAPSCRKRGSRPV